ncbi:hypothetical protein BV22DRAFT_1132836 [Leucogyrophana mollusca]|uniref:Uncharacterized protein n=1 Tax=Leucogyrophana mollusca TaxID=85980 RepID=A0ACB8B4U4_9AGAM|nr:hypothetical protein BV22DRAFT_1132836 [Leucogyrophana mollusca]
MLHSRQSSPYASPPISESSTSEAGTGHCSDAEEFPRSETSSPDSTVSKGWDYCSRMEDIRNKLLDITQPSSASIAIQTYQLAYATAQTCCAFEAATCYKLEQQKLYVAMLEEEFADAKTKLEEAQAILLELFPPNSVPAPAL